MDGCMEGCMESYMEGCMINPILLSISSQSYPPINFFSILSSYEILLNPIPLDAPTHAIPSPFCHLPTTI